MPTLLTTSRMSPELRARIVQSLHSDARSRAGGRSFAQGARLIRILIVVGLVVVAGALITTFRQSRQEFHAAHHEMLREYSKLSEPFDGEYGKRLAFLDDFLAKADEEYRGDLIDASVQGDLEALDRRLKRPLVFVRGSTRGFGRESQRRSTWGDGGPGAWIRCLMAPPNDTKESTLLRHLGAIYEPSAFRDRFVNLDQAFRGMDFVNSDYGARLRSASLNRELSSLGAQLTTAPLDEARDFTRVRTFAYALDEPKVKGTVSDFDGEAEHYMRVGLIDLTTQKELLRLRRRVDPEWISEKSRLSYSRPLDSCKLAFEVREELAGN